VTEGTDFEQLVLAALQAAAMKPGQDVIIINARPADSLAAFIAGSVDAFSAGLTERINAKEHGAVELILGPDITPAPIDGLVTTRQYAQTHERELNELGALFFQTVRFMEDNIRGNSVYVRDYMRGRASINYTADQYAIAWTFQEFPHSASVAYSYFQDSGGRYYWKPIWDELNTYLIQQKKIGSAVPYSEYFGERSLSGMTPLDH
jgi:hypothetical protein